MSKLFLDSLDKTRLEVFEKLAAFDDYGSLGGGTAIALQIGHRRSFDFDIFTTKPIEPRLWRNIKTALGQNCLKNLDTPDQLNLITPENIAVTFFHDDYPLMFAPLDIKPIRIMDLKDLASSKVRIIGRRGKWRDYVDLYFLIKNGSVALKETIEISEKRFGGEFSSRLFLQQLSYFGDITDYKIDFLGPEVEPETIKQFLTKEATVISRQLIS